MAKITIKANKLCNKITIFIIENETIVQACESNGTHTHTYSQCANGCPRL